MLSIASETEPAGQLLIKDASQFESIFKAHYAQLSRVAFRIVKDKELAEDIVQELFARLWEKRESLFISVPPKAYLSRSTVNAALDALEKQKRSVSLEEAQPSFSQLSVNQTEEQLALRETTARIDQALDKLPTACRAVFVLSRNEEMSYQQIADAMEISVKTVENQMGKALKIMRQELLPYLGKLIKLLFFYFPFSEIFF